MHEQTLKDKIPPHHLEAEQSVLGAILLEREALNKAQSLLRAEDFYRIAHQKIFQSVVNLAERNEAADIITISDELKATKELDIVGGVSYISRLTSIVPSAANVEYYAKIVKECSVRRKLLHIASEMSALSYEQSNESRLIIETAEKGLFEITDNQESTNFRRVRDLVSPAVAAIEAAFKRKGQFTGVPSGYSDLDSMTAGFQNSEFIIIGARPSIGKTALALSMASNMACRSHPPIPVGFFSLEMSSAAIMQRFISMEAQLNAQRVKTGFLQISDFKSITDAAGVLYEAPIWVADTPNMRLLDLCAQARRMKAQHGVRVIFIDYLSLVTPERTEIPRYEQIAEISRRLKALARELQIPVIALSQVKRETEGKQPNLADLRESGSIEQDADIVMFLHRDRQATDGRKDGGKQSGPLVIPTELIVAKQRNGPIGTVELGFISDYARFESLTKN